MPKFGDLVSGVVIKIIKNREGNDIGALVKIESGDVTFLPVKEISKNYVKKIEDYIKVGQKINVRITGKNMKFNQFGVSLKKANEEVNVEVDFQKKLEKFMKDSGEKMRQLQKNKDRKHNGRKKKDKPSSKNLR
jgi:S1 RNA binding domain protein